MLLEGSGLPFPANDRGEFGHKPDAMAFIYIEYYML
jgi:hypothetical protein